MLDRTEPAVRQLVARERAHQDPGSERIMRILLAAASGVFGTVLVPALTAAGHDVTGFTRTAVGSARITELGGAPQPPTSATAGPCCTLSRAGGTTRSSAS